MAKRPKAPIKAEDAFPSFATGNEFDRLSDSDKERVYNYYDSHPNIKGRPLNKAEQKTVSAQVAAERRRIGRPIVGEGSRMIAVSIEAGLLRQADAYAKSHGLKRTQLIAQGLRAIIGKPRKSA